MKALNSPRALLATCLTLLALLASACGAPGGDEATDRTTESADAATDTTAGEATDTQTDVGGAADEGPIAIGIVAPFSGPFSVVSEDLIAGWEMYWEERGNTEVAGREVVWHTADDANDPATGITQANALVSQQGIDMLVGPVTTAVGAAVAEEMNRQGIPVFAPVLSDDNVTQRNRLEGVVRIAGWTASQVTHPFGQWAYDQGHRRIATLCFDLQFGYEHCGGFANTFTDAGGEIVTQLWHQIGEQDYASLVSQLRDADPDAVFIGNSGPDAVRVLQAWADFGLKDEIPLLVTETVADQTTLRNVTPESALGVISAGHFAEGRDAPATAEFTERFLEAHGRMPSYFAAAMYAAAEWIARGIEDVEGDLSDEDAFLDAIRAVQLDETPLGPVELDEYDHTTLDIYIREVRQREDGLLWNEVIDTFEDVSQFWTYDPEEYLQTPAYSREYQGIE